MGMLDHQIGFGEESTYGTAVTPTRFFEFNSEGIEETYGRVESEGLRVQQLTPRNDRWSGYFSGAAGTVQLDVLTKGFGVLFKHALGSVVTTGPGSDGEYSHTASLADAWGKSLTMQVARPLNPSGTVQPFTYRGGKVTEWTLSNSVEANLLLELGLDFQQVATDTVLAAASYPAAMDNFTWAGGEVLIGGDGYPVTEISVACANNLNVDRRFIAKETNKKEPNSNGRREVTFSLATEFDSLTQRNRAAATSRAGALAALVARWVGPVPIGGTTYPKVEVTIPAARFDEWSGSVDGPEGIAQELSGIGMYDGTNAAVKVEYVSADTTV